MLTYDWKKISKFFTLSEQGVLSPISLLQNQMKEKLMDDFLFSIPKHCLSKYHVVDRFLIAHMSQIRLKEM